MNFSAMGKRLPRLFWVVLSALAFSSLALGAGDDDWERLRQIPREQRVHLDKKLREFDALDRGEQASIRALDETLAALPEGDRANHYAVMRRYHLWLQTLTEAQRNELNAVPLSKRMRVVEKLRAGQRATKPSTPMLFRIGDFGGASPYDLATRIKVWLRLSAAEKAEVSKLPEDGRRRRMNELARSLKVAPVTEPALSDEQAKTMLDRALKKAPLLDALLKRGDDEKKKAARQRRVLESYYLLEHPPERVKTENLLRFDAALPPWIRATFDTLSADEARRSLSILYRLVFPAPKEMEPSKSAVLTPASAPTKDPPPASKKAVTPPGKGALSRPTGPF
jgi:hypothetical protein